MQIKPIYKYASLAWFHKGYQNLHQSGFPGTIWSQQTEDAIPKCEINILKCMIPVGIDFI